MLWQPVILFVLNEVIQIKNMPKINEAVCFVRFVRLPVVHNQIQVVELTLVVLLEVSL